MACANDIFICLDCGARDGVTSGSHHKTHALVKCQVDTVKNNSNYRLTAERADEEEMRLLGEQTETLARKLDERFDAQESKLHEWLDKRFHSQDVKLDRFEERLLRIENLLERVLSRVSTSVPS